MKQRIRCPLIILILGLCVGCVSTRHEEEKTGLFENDCKKMLNVFDQVKESETTKENLEELGFSIGAPNVRLLSGSKGMTEIFGDQCFDTALRDPKNAELLLVEMNRYQMVVIPFKDIVTTEDRFYFSTKNTDTEGKDVALLFVLKDGKVIYKAAEVVNIDKHESEHAFAEGLLNFIERFGGSLGKIYDLLKKFKP